MHRVCSRGRDSLLVVDVEWLEGSDFSVRGCVGGTGAEVIRGDVVEKMEKWRG